LTRIDTGWPKASLTELRSKPSRLPPLADAARFGQTLAHADNRKVANEPLPVAKAKFSAIFNVRAFSAHISVLL